MTWYNLFYVYSRIWLKGMCGSFSLVDEYRQLIDCIYSVLLLRYTVEADDFGRENGSLQAERD